MTSGFVLSAGWSGLGPSGSHLLAGSAALPADPAAFGARIVGSFGLSDSLRCRIVSRSCDLHAADRAWCRAGYAVDGPARAAMPERRRGLRKQAQLLTKVDD